MSSIDERATRKFNSVFNDLMEHENLDRLHQLSGERRLLLALLDRAFMDLESEDIKLRKDAERWFFAAIIEDPSVTSLQYICNLFGISSLKILRRIQGIDVKPHREISIEHCVK